VNEPIGHRTQDLQRQQVVRIIRNASRKDNVAVHYDGLAFALQPQGIFATAPIAGPQTLDLRSMLDGHPALDDKPIMYWKLSGSAFMNVRHQVIEAAQAEHVSIHADQISFVSDPRATFVNAPIVGVEKTDLAALLNGQTVFSDTPVMYWDFSGPAVEDGDMLAIGSYTSILARLQR
jgi:hypothetical protein